jgi:hypothetical protein
VELPAITKRQEPRVWAVRGAGGRIVGDRGQVQGCGIFDINLVNATGWNGNYIFVRTGLEFIFPGLSLDICTCS